MSTHRHCTSGNQTYFGQINFVRRFKYSPREIPELPIHYFLFYFSRNMNGSSKAGKGRLSPLLAHKTAFLLHHVIPKPNLDWAVRKTQPRPLAIRWLHAWTSIKTVGRDRASSREGRPHPHKGEKY